MELKLPAEIAENYSSGSQRIRVMTEDCVKDLTQMETINRRVGLPLS
jgi:hypothetical protein